MDTFLLEMFNLSPPPPYCRVPRVSDELTFPEEMPHEGSKQVNYRHMPPGADAARCQLPDAPRPAGAQGGGSAEHQSCSPLLRR